MCPLNFRKSSKKKNFVRARAILTESVFLIWLTPTVLYFCSGNTTEGRLRRRPPPREFLYPTLLLLEGLLGQCEVCQLLLHIGGEELVGRGEVKPIDYIFKHPDGSSRQPMGGNGSCTNRRFHLLEKNLSCPSCRPLLFKTLHDPWTRASLLTSHADFS